jgi:hypothetical protein
MLIKCYKNPKFFILKVEIDFKNNKFVTIYSNLKNLLMIIYFFHKHENFLKTSKIN